MPRSSRPAPQPSKPPAEAPSAALDALGRSFARDLRAEGVSTRTITIYGQALRYFGEWLAADGRPAVLAELTRPAIRAWLASLAEAGRAPGTIRTRHRGLARFTRWLVAEGELDTDPMAGMVPPSSPETPVPLISDTDLAKLLKACAGKRFEDRRDEAMFRVLLDCGIRASELTGLTLEGTDLEREMAMVTGKGRKQRVIYFSARTVRALDRYLRMRPTHRWAHLDALWLTQRGALSTDGLRERLNIRAAAAGLEHMHPHQFRHTAADSWLSAGGQERDLKRIMGWSSDSMLERYGSARADARASEAARRLRRGDRV